MNEREREAIKRLREYIAENAVDAEHVDYDYANSHNWSLAGAALDALLAECEQAEGERAKLRAEAAETGRCSCGLHEIRAGIHGVQWYWARHARAACTLELPNARCWCGRLRSEHQDAEGHDPKTRDEAWRYERDLQAAEPTFDRFGGTGQPGAM